MTHVWVIEQGEYSDYRVVGVYTSREKAELVAKALRPTWGDKPTVTQWPLNPALEQVNTGLGQFNVTIKRDGTVQFVGVHDFSGMPMEDDFQLGRGGYLTAKVWARDKKHAVKIVNERRAQMIANGEWK